MKREVAAEIVDGRVIFGALMGAIAWNLITWYFGLPSSSSHALMGGLGGAAIAKAGFPALQLGGWRIVRTMGTRITKLRPFGGFCAETAGGISILIASGLGVPVSTTHTITGAIIGVGATKRLSAVRWGVTVNLLWAWILTIPVSGLLAAGVYKIVSLFL